jgi:hypothetical protein
MDLVDIEWEGVDWMHLTQYRDQWRSLVNTVMNLRVPKNEEFLDWLWAFHGTTSLLRIGTLWRCGDGLFFEVPPLTSDALLTTLHSLLDLQTQVREKCGGREMNMRD